MIGDNSFSEKTQSEISSKLKKILSSSSSSTLLHRNASTGSILTNQAIKPNNHKKEIKAFRPNSTKRITKEEQQKIIDNMLIRFNEYQEKSKIKVNQLKTQIEEKENKELSFAPKLHKPISLKKSISNKENYLTRSTNYNEYINHKAKQNLIAQERKQQSYMNPKLNKKAKLEDINKNLSSLFEWEQTKKQKLQRQQEIKKDKEMENCTFKPSLNKNSLKIANNMISHDKKLSRNNNDSILHKSQYSIEQKGFFQPELIHLIPERASDITITYNKPFKTVSIIANVNK